MSEHVAARVFVRGRGLLVTEATPAAEAVTQRDLVGMPLSESMWEESFHGVLSVIRRAVVEKLRLTDIVEAPNGQVGRVVADPCHDGATVTFLPLEYAIHEVYGPDLICGVGNEEFQRRAHPRWYVGLAAVEAFPEACWHEAQDALRWVMRTGVPRTVDLPPGTRMAIRLVSPGVVRTCAR